MSVADYVEAIRSRASLFDMEQDGPESKRSEILSLCPEGISGDVVRLRRKGCDSGGLRTILIVGQTGLDKIHLVLSWAAGAREYLPDPEASDLYLFLVGGEIENFVAHSIELNDSFCRRMVRRTGEALDHFYNRSFLAEDLESREGGSAAGLDNPLVSALHELVNAGGLTETQVRDWHLALTTIQGGQDLAVRLRAIVETQEVAL